MTDITTANTTTTGNTRNRINITLTKELRDLLERLASFDNMPLAKKATELLTKAAVDAEDGLELAIIERRKSTDPGWLTHEEAWG